MTSPADRSTPADRSATGESAHPTGDAGSARNATSAERSSGGSLTPAVRGALLRYRIIAYVVGVMLLLLVFLAMPLKYFADNPSAMDVIGPAHGFLYMVYLLASFDLARRVRWPLPRLVLVALAGTIPFVSFYAERKVHHELTR